MVDKETPQNQLAPSTPSTVRQMAQEAEEGKIIKLPSGLVFRVARPSISNLIRQNKFPSSLVNAALSSGSKNMSAKQVQDSLEVMDILVCESVKEPKVVRENPTDNEILVSEISDNDKGFIMGYVQRGVTALEPFRTE